MDLLITPYVLANLDDNAVQIHNRINGIKWSGLPFGDSVDYAVGDFGNERCRHIGIVHFLECSNDFTGAQALGIQRQDLIIHLRQAALVLPQKLRLKRSIAVTRAVDLNFAVLALQTFGRAAISAVALGEFAVSVFA